MLSLIKKIWHDPVWSKVVAAMILGSVVYISPFWPRVINIFSVGFAYLMQYTLVQNWLIIIVTIVFLIFLIILVLAVFNVSKEPEWLNKYREDIFFGVRWRWKYVDNQTSSLRSYCPACNLQIYAKYIGMAPKLTFTCEVCNKDYPSDSETYDSLENKVERLIHQQINNNSWHKDVK